MVDPRLAAHGAVDLREQRGRHLYEIDPAHVTGGRETGDVPRNAPAQRNDGRVAVGAVLDQRIQDVPDGLERLVRFAVGQADRPHLLAREVRQQRFEIQRFDGFVGDHETVGAANVGRKIEAAAEQAAADKNRIAALAELDRNGSWIRHGGRRLQHTGEAHRRE